MNKDRPLFYIIVFLATSGFLIEADHLAAQDQKAAEVIQQSQSYYLGLKDLSVDFTYEIKGISSRQKLLKGNLSLQKAKYILKMRDQVTFCNGQRIWVHLPEQNEYMVFSMGEWTYGNIIQLMYSMYYSPANKFYKGLVTLPDGTRAHKIRFDMKYSNVGYATAFAWYDEATKLISRVTFLDRQKRQRTFYFSNLRVNKGFQDSEFEFNPQKHPGIELRR